VVIMIDSSKPVTATVNWLRLFCNRLDTVLRKGHHAHRKLSEIVVVLNKRDKVSPDECEELTENVREVLKRHLSVILGAERAKTIPVLECISIQTAQGSVLIDAVLAHLAEQLAG
jgi:GTP-binding protein EngB required for normal cell division